MSIRTSSMSRAIEFTPLIQAKQAFTASKKKSHSTWECDSSLHSSSSHPTAAPNNAYNRVFSPAKS